MLWASNSILSVSAVLTVGKCLAQVLSTWRMACLTVRLVGNLD